MSFNKTGALRQAEQYVSQGDLSSAIAVYRKIIDADPMDISAISALGDLYVKSNRTKEAIDYFLRISENFLRKGSTNSATYLLMKILKIDSLNETAHMKLGEIYLRDGLNEKAHDCFIEAGAAFWQKNNARGAREANMKALQANPNSRQVKAAMAALQEETYEYQPQPVQAPVTTDFAPIMISITDEPHGNGNIEIAGDEHIAERIADVEYLASHQTPMAILDEKTIVAHLSAAEILVAYGKIDDAVTKLRTLLKQKPDDIEVRVKLKDVYLRGERIDRASEECLNIAGIYAARGDSLRAKDFMIRAELLDRTFQHMLSEIQQDDGDTISHDVLWDWSD